MPADRDALLALADVNAAMRAALLEIERECSRCRGDQSYRDTVRYVARIARNAAALRGRAEGGV